MIEIWIPHEPVSKQRPRSAKGGRTYTPEKTRNFEKKVREFVEAWLSVRMKKPPLYEQGVALSVIAIFYFDRPNYLLKKSVKDEALWHSKGKDIDNLSKSLLDALNGVIWYDDAQISALHLQKFYVARGGESGIRLFVNESSEDEKFGGDNERESD